MCKGHTSLALERIDFFGQFNQSKLIGYRRGEKGVEFSKGQLPQIFFFSPSELGAKTKFIHLPIKDEATRTDFFGGSYGRRSSRVSACSS